MRVYMQEKVIELLQLILSQKYGTEIKIRKEVKHGRSSNT